VLERELSLKKASLPGFRLAGFPTTRSLDYVVTVLPGFATDWREARSFLLFHDLIIVAKH